MNPNLGLPAANALRPDPTRPDQDERPLLLFHHIAFLPTPTSKGTPISSHELLTYTRTLPALVILFMLVRPRPMVLLRNRKTENPSHLPQYNKPLTASFQIYNQNIHITPVNIMIYVLDLILSRIVFGQTLICR
jgi:hypothetical protein